MQRRRLITLAATAGMVCLTGCATATPTPPALLLRLPPAALGRRLALAQQLTIRTRQREFQLEALLEADDEALQLALLALGQPVARLRWDGHALTQQQAPGWPAAVSAERVLSDLVLVLWPAAAVAAALPPEWSLQDGSLQDGPLQDDGRVRRLRWRDTLVQQVRYDNRDNLQRVLLEHLVQGYSMQIDSQPVLP